MRPAIWPCGEFAPHDEHQHVGPDNYFYRCPGRDSEFECDPTCAPHLFQYCSPVCEQRFKAEGNLEGIPVNERDYDANEAWFA